MLSTRTRIQCVGKILPVLLFVLAFGCSRSEPPHLIFVSVDTLRADHLGCYGYERETSPAIDAFAREGTLFRRATAQRGSTLPSLASIMTSLHPVSHGVRSNSQRFSSEELSLAEFLSSHGYTCAAFFGSTVVALQTWEGFEVIKVAKNDMTVTSDALAWLENNVDKRVFLWVHYFAPHTPYAPPRSMKNPFISEYSGSINGSVDTLASIMLGDREMSEADLDYLVSLYDTEILLDDMLMNQILTKLDDLGMSENSLVVFTADHGEELYQHNRYFKHQASTHMNVLHIPLIFRWPGSIARGRQIDDVVESIDIAPTILQLMGFEIPQVFQGKSLMPLLNGDNATERPAYSEWRDKILSITTPKYHYIYNPTNYDPPMHNKTHLKMFNVEVRPVYQVDAEELYDLTEDPLEQSNIISREPDTAKELRGRLLEWKRQFGWKFDGGTKNPQMPAELQKELQALGYVR